MDAKACLMLALVLLATFINAYSEDPDILSDFVLPNGASASSSFFTFSGLRRVFKKTHPSSSFKVSKVTQMEFPALNGQGVSMAVLQFAPKGINPLHTHPRSTEMLLVVKGSLEVGFVDTNNTLFTQILQTGDVFVFPKGTVHFQLNRDYKKPAIAISAFGSANAGTVALPTALFASGIDKEVLAKSFKTDVDTVGKLVPTATMG